MAAQYLYAGNARFIIEQFYSYPSDKSTTILLDCNTIFIKKPKNGSGKLRNGK